jgi:hypothetical protein
VDTDPPSRNITHGLEDEATLKFYRTPRQPGGGRAKLRIRGWARTAAVGNRRRVAPKAKWRQIELVKNVIGGHANLDIGFSDILHRGEREGL